MRKPDPVKSRRKNVTNNFTTFHSRLRWRFPSDVRCHTCRKPMLPDDPCVVSTLNGHLQATKVRHRACFERLFQ